MHITGFAPWAGLTEDQITSLTHGTAGDACWDQADRVLIDLCDSLHHSATVDDQLWARLHPTHTEEAILELLLLAGFYRATSYLVNTLTLPLEAGMARFDDYPAPTSPSS